MNHTVKSALVASAIVAVFVPFAACGAQSGEATKVSDASIVAEYPALTNQDRYLSILEDAGLPEPPTEKAKEIYVDMAYGACDNIRQFGYGTAVQIYRNAADGVTLTSDQYGFIVEAAQTVYCPEA